MDTRIRLDNELVVRGICGSRTEAKETIERGNVLVNGVMCLKSSRKVLKSAKIEVSKKKPFVSRAGEKLQGVLLDIFETDDKVRNTVSGASVLDVGSSTGGFTDCMLLYGAKLVDCVDVGTNQLHETLRNNGKVMVFENQDIRSFQKNRRYDFVLADLSFIPLESVAKDLIRLGEKGTRYIILIKPQFEVGRGNTKKGIVKDKKRIVDAVAKVRDIFEESGLHTTEIFQSHLLGGDGNQEYFLYGSL